MYKRQVPGDPQKHGAAELYPVVCSKAGAGQVLQAPVERLLFFVVGSSDQNRDAGPAQVLVNVVGIHIYADITETTQAIWETSLNANLVSAATLARGFVPAMKRTKGAAIVNISSRNALSSSPKSATYDASKAGLLALTRTLGVELGRLGIRVNAVSPGSIIFPGGGWERMRDDEPELFAAYERDGFRMGRLG